MNSEFEKNVIVTLYRDVDANGELKPPIFGIYCGDAEILITPDHKNNESGVQLLISEGNTLKKPFNIELTIEHPFSDLKISLEFYGDDFGVIGKLVSTMKHHIRTINVNMLINSIEKGKRG